MTKAAGQLTDPIGTCSDMTSSDCEGLPTIRPSRRRNSRSDTLACACACTLTALLEEVQVAAAVDRLGVVEDVPEHTRPVVETEDALLVGGQTFTGRQVQLVAATVDRSWH